MVFTTSEAQCYPWAQNIKISFYQVYFHAKIQLTRGGAAENLTTLVTIPSGYAAPLEDLECACEVGIF